MEMMEFCMRVLLYIVIYSGNSPGVNLSLCLVKQSCTQVKKISSWLCSGDICLEARVSVVSVCSAATGRVQTVICSFAVLFFLLIGDNITMLTTADWLLGSNSQSAAGLSTLSGRMAREHLLFSTLSEWRHALQNKNKCSQCSSNQLSDVNGCAFHSEKLQKLWYSVSSMVWHWLDLSSVFKNGQIVILFLQLRVPGCFLTTFFLPRVCFMHAPCHYFSIGVKNPPRPPRQHVSLPSTCTTWQKIASSTMRDSTEHDFRAHIVDLFHEKNKWTWRERKSSCLPKVKWTDFKELWAVRMLRNYQCRSIPELHNQTRSKSVRCIH